MADARKPFEKKHRARSRQELEPADAKARETEAWLASAEAYEEANRERLKALDAAPRRGGRAHRALEEDWLWAQANMETEVNRVRE